MKAFVYKQTYDDIVYSKAIRLVEQTYGFTRIPCPDCDGTGIFLMPDNRKEMCVICKSSGWHWATL